MFETVPLDAVLEVLTRRELEPSTRPERRCCCHGAPLLEARGDRLRCAKSRRIVTAWRVVDAVTGETLTTGNINAPLGPPLPDSGQEIECRP